MRKLLPIFFLVCLFCNDVEADSERALDIEPVQQSIPVWCWDAVSEMVLRYFDQPNYNPAGDYQCGIVAVYAGPNTRCWGACRLRECVSPIGHLSGLRRLITQYDDMGDFLRSTYCMRNGAYCDVRATDLEVRSGGALRFAEIKREIDRGNPIIAGVNFGAIYQHYDGSGVSQHVVVVAGYRESPDGQFILVNEPFDYGFRHASNPYLFQGGERVQPGQYWVNYDAFRGQSIGYNNSLIVMD